MYLVTNQETLAITQGFRMLFICLFIFINIQIYCCKNKWQYGKYLFTDQQIVTHVESHEVKDDIFSPISDIS